MVDMAKVVVIIGVVGVVVGFYFGVGIVGDPRYARDNF